MTKPAVPNIERFKQSINELVDAISYDNLDSYNILGHVPIAVVSPKTVGELSRILAAANQHGLSVSPRGGGTKTEIGNPPTSLDIVIEMSNLNQVLEYAPADLTATVQAGITMERLQNSLAEHGQFLAIDPTLPDQSTVGGVLATGTSGPSKWHHGNPRDTVIGMKVVTADGSVTKSGGQVVKNVSGYDMSRLHIGGLGTLGIITEVSFKLTPLPQKQLSVLASFNSGRTAAEASLGIFHSDLMPLAITTFDSASNTQIATTGINGSVAAVRIAGRPATIKRCIKESATVFNQFGARNIEVFDQHDVETFWRYVSDFGWGHKDHQSILCRANVLPSLVPDLIELIDQAPNTSGLKSNQMSHPAHGTVVIEWSTKENSMTNDLATTAISTIINYVRRLNGNVIIERCPNEFRGQMDVWGEVGDSLDVMRRLKEQYDPNQTINPGRFVGGI